MQDATDVDIPEPDAPPRRRRWWWAVGGGVLLLLLAAVAASVYFLVPGMRGSEPENTAKYFPEDTAIYSWATFSPGIGQGAEMRELWNRLEELPGFEDAVDGLLEDAEAETGIDFEQQVLPWIGPDVSVGVLSLGAGDQTGELVALIGVRDHGAASAFVRDLSGSAQQDWVSLQRDDDIHGFEVRTDWGTGVGLALSSDWLVLASSEAALNDVVELIAEPGQRSLADSDRFRQARAAMRDERAMSAYLDLEAVVGLASELSGIGEAAVPPLDHDDRRGAVPVTVGDAVPGALDSVDEADVLVFDGEAGTQYQIDVALGTLFDSVATLYDADGIALAHNDDLGLSLASRIDWLAEHSGPYYVVVEGYAGDTGSYTLTVNADTETADAAAGTVGDSGVPDWMALSVGFVDLGIVIEWASPLGSSAFADIALDDEPAALLPDDTVFFGAAAFEPDMDRWRAELGTYTVADVLGADVANELAAETGLEADSSLAELLDDVVEVIDDEIGISLEEDLFDLLGGQALIGVRDFDLERFADPDGYAIDAIAAVSYIPGGEEDLRRTVDKLVDRLEEAWGESFPARAPKDIGADHEAVTFGGADIDAAAYSPGYVFHNGYLTVATTERALQSVVDSQKGTRGTLAGTREYRRVRDSLPGTLDFLVYIDLHRIIAGLDPDALDLDPDVHHVLESVFGAVAVGASSDDDYARASLVMTLFPQ